MTPAPDEGAPGQSEHRLAILRRDGAGELAILLLKAGDHWTLPRVELPEERSADVADVNQAVKASLGLETSVLRCLADEPGACGQPRRHLHALEAHGVDQAPRCGQWVTRDAALAESWPDVARVEPCLRSAKDDTAHDWARLGWREKVLAWVGEELDRRGWPPVSEVTQVRVWEFSQVLSLRTGAGQFYFKARPTCGAHEAAVTNCLAARHPASTPDVIAIEPERGWFLMRATEGRQLMEVGEIERWTSAVATIARMQIDWLTGIDELVALGCPRRSLAELEAEVGPLVGDAVLLQPDRADGLSHAEMTSLRSRQRALAALCRELAAYGVRDSLEHGDLWGENVIAAQTGPVFIDWEDASVAHPFFTPALLRLSLDYTRALDDVPDAAERLREAYLRPWADRGPLTGWSRRRLEEAFDLAQRVAMIHYAVQFRRAISQIDTSWEVRAYAPLFLRRLLAP